MEKHIKYRFFHAGFEGSLNGLMNGEDIMKMM